MKPTDVRVLLVAANATPGGTQEILFNLAVTVPAFGIRPQVILLQHGPLAERLAGHGVEVRVIDAGRLRDLRSFWTTSRQLAAAVRTAPVDVIYSNEPKAHLYAVAAARRHGVPALWTQAGYPEPVHWIDRIATALPAAGVIALSHAVAAAQTRVNARRTVHVVHPGIDIARFRVGGDAELRSQQGIPADSTLVSLVGRLQPWKGQREFLRAAAMLASSHPGARFAIVGGATLGWEGDYPEELTRLAASLGIGDRVIFTGHTGDVHRWMAASDVVVNASAPEPFGLVLVEAMACGCTVVAVNQGGPRDIIEDGVSGMLCASREPAELARVIGLSLAHPERRRELGAAARSRVETYFTREIMAKHFAAIVCETARA